MCEPLSDLALDARHSGIVWYGADGPSGISRYTPHLSTVDEQRSRPQPSPDFGGESTGDAESRVLVEQFDALLLILRQVRYAVLSLDTMLSVKLRCGAMLSL